MLGPLPIAALSRVDVVAVVMAFGFLVGVVGHVIRSRTMIVTGIIVVAMASAYVVYVPNS